MRAHRLLRVSLSLTATLATAAIVLFAGCGSDSGPTGPGATEGVAAYMNGLPRWSTANPLLVAADERTPGATMEQQVSVASYLDSDTGEDGPAALLCQETPISLKDNNADIVILNPTAGLIWPGALIQGASRTGNTTELSPLVIAPEDRTPITVFLEGITTPGIKSVEVTNPSPSAVDGARSQLVLAASTDNVGDPSTINSSVKVYQSDSDFAFSASFSGKYLNWKASASSSYERSQTENSVVVYFAERMYTLVADPPSSPSAWFGSGFTQEELDRKIAAGEIGPDNLPVYVSSVTYGRIMMATFTASTDAEKLKAAISVRYDGLLSSGGGSLSAAQSTMIDRSEKVWSFWGGDAGAAAAAIQSGDWQQYFSTQAELSQAVPISFTLSTMRGELAQVTDVTQYTLRDCVKITEAEYAFLPVEQLSPSVPLPRETRIGDFNGDGSMDLFWDHDPGLGSAHSLAVAYGQSGSGIGASFMVENVPVALSPQSNGGIGSVLDIGNFDGDGPGTDDAVWYDPNVSGTNNAEFQYVLGSPGGLATKSTSSWTITQEATNPVWGPAVNYKMALGEFSPSSPGEEIALTCAGNTNWNRVYRFDFAGVGNPFTNLPSDQGTPWRTIFSDGWNPFDRFRTVDLVGDSTDDLMFAYPNAAFTHTEFTNVDGVFWAGHSDMGNLGLNQPEQDNFHVVAAVKNGKEGYAWIDPTQTQPTIRFQEFTGGNMAPPTRVNFGPDSFTPGTRGTSAVGYFDGDANFDFLANALSPGVNKVRLGFNYDHDGSRQFSRIFDVEHPADDPDWANAVLHTGDVNGDNLTDLVWVIDENPDVRVYVALRTRRQI